MYLKGEKKILDSYRDKMIHNHEDFDISEDEFDPQLAARELHDETISHHREALIKAYSERKSEILPTALKMFNKIQDLHVKTYRLNEFERVDEDKKKIEDVQGTLARFEKLLNDTRSPIVSGIVDSSKYKTSPLPEMFEEHYKHEDDYGSKIVDVDMMRRDRNKLRKLALEISAIKQSLNTVKEQQEAGIRHPRSALKQLERF